MDLVDNPMENEDPQEEITDDADDSGQVTFEELEGGSKDDDEWEDSANEDNLFFDVSERKEADEKDEVEEKEDETKEDADKIKEDIIQHLDGKTEVTIKGKKYDLKDLSGEEIVKRFQLAGRAYEVMQKSAEDSKNTERLIEQAVEAKLRQHLQGVQTTQAQTESKDDELPDYLKPTEMDTDETKALKQSQALLLKEINSLKTNVDARADSFAEQQFIAEVDRHTKDYPSASIDEVIAIKSLRPDIPTDEIMRASHEHYSSTDFIKSALEANPEAKRELFEMAIKEYKAKVQKAKSQTVPRRRSGGSVSKKVTEKLEKPISTFAEIEANPGKIEAYIRDRMKQRQGG
jgi:hypothetical protein